MTTTTLLVYVSKTSHAQSRGLGDTRCETKSFVIRPDKGVALSSSSALKYWPWLLVGSQVAVNLCSPEVVHGSLDVSSDCKSSISGVP